MNFLHFRTFFAQAQRSGRAAEKSEPKASFSRTEQQRLEARVDVEAIATRLKSPTEDLCPRSQSLVTNSRHPVLPQPEEAGGTNFRRRVRNALAGNRADLLQGFGDSHQQIFGVQWLVKQVEIMTCAICRRQQIDCRGLP